MSEWIKLDDGSFAECVAPDPKRIISLEELQAEIIKKEEEVLMYSREIMSLTEIKEAIENEILQLNNVLNE